MHTRPLRQWLVLVLLALGVAGAAAAVEVNTATQAQLETVLGIGPGMSERILAQRRIAPFKDWQDLSSRVGGVGKGGAARLSKAGLTVNGLKADGTAETPARATSAASR